MGISLVIVKSDTKKIEGKSVSPIHLKYSFKGGVVFPKLRPVGFRVNG